MKRTENDYALVVIRNKTFAMKLNACSNAAFYLLKQISINS